MSAFVAPGAIDLAVVATGAVASIWDVRTRRIPNAVTFGSAAVAVAFHAFDAGSLPRARRPRLERVRVGRRLPALSSLVLGGMGAGDVKLLAAMGAWLGPAPSAGSQSMAASRAVFWRCRSSWRGAPSAGTGRMSGASSDTGGSPASGPIPV